MKLPATCVLNAVVEMQRRYAGRPQDLEGLLGPSIRVDDYEVGEEVAACFTPEVIERRPEWPRPNLDLARAARRQLPDAGLAEERVFDTGLCTFSSPETFPSYRRDGDKSSRMVAAIGTL